MWGEIIQFCRTGTLSACVGLLLSAGYTKLFSGNANAQSNIVDNSVSPAVVVSTWAFPGFPVAAQTAWDTLVSSSNRLEAVVAGCSTCEKLQCDGTVGYGGSPDENGETALDALIFDGPTHNMGAVGHLKNVKNAIGVARAVMEYTQHSILVGEAATMFAVEMNFQTSNLTTPASLQKWQKWLLKNCQPNFRQNVAPDPKTSCGPYKPTASASRTARQQVSRGAVGQGNHDTIGMVVVDENGDVAAGTSTNGASYKVPGRVGDSPIPGAGAYVDNDVGGAAETGDGDVMMRFLPSYQTVENMRLGMSPSEAAGNALMRIHRFYPNFQGAIVAASKTGDYGAACHGIGNFSYCVANAQQSEVRILTVRCVDVVGK